MLIDIVREYVEKSCEAPENALGPSFYSQHLLVVEKYAGILAGRFKADPEILELASLLHDQSAVLDIKTLPTHAADSALMAEKFLQQQGYPHDRCALVGQCVRNHVSPLAVGKGTPEDVCLSNADAVALIARPAYWCYFAFSVRKLPYAQGHEWLRNRVETNWNTMVPEARELIGDEYRISKNVFG